jgi:hypothetical protein
MTRWSRIGSIACVAASVTSSVVGSQVGGRSETTPKRVLVLRALYPGAPAQITSERIYQERLRQAFGTNLEYYSELIDVFRFMDPPYESEFEDYLARKYRDHPIDLLIAGGPRSG